MADLYLTKKVVILKKIRLTIKTFAPTHFNHFSLTLNRIKRVVMKAMRKKLNIFTLQLPIYYILDWCKYGHCINEATEIECGI